MTLDQLIEQADKKLNWMLYGFEEKLNIQMLKLQFGPKYVDDLLDSIITELSIDKTVGRYEKY